MSDLPPYHVSAYNTAKSSENKIHDDATAKRFGFKGGLVGGVHVYAYMSHMPVQRWGRAWLERGTGEARFGHLAGAKTLREFFHAPGGVDKFLLAGEKGMAGRANAEAEILFSGAGVIDRTAGADDLAFHVLGVNIRFHGSWTRYPNSPEGQA